MPCRVTSKGEIFMLLEDGDFLSLVDHLWICEIVEWSPLCNERCSWNQQMVIEHLKLEFVLSKSLSLSVTRSSIVSGAAMLMIWREKIWLKEDPYGLINQVQSNKSIWMTQIFLDIKPKRFTRNTLQRRMPSSIFSYMSEPSSDKGSLWFTSWQIFITMRKIMHKYLSNGDAMIMMIIMSFGIYGNDDGWWWW